MTREEAKEKLYMEWQKFLEDNIDYAGISEAYKMAFKALSQEPCDDAISREWLMRKATERFYTTNYFNHISAMIEEAPSVTQKSDNKYRKEAKRWKNKWLKSQKGDEKNV